ncbi:MAG: STN domain-containing protein [Planctomycetota bacterium]|jgi:hypothetical protein
MKGFVLILLILVLTAGPTPRSQAGESHPPPPEMETPAERIQKALARNLSVDFMDERFQDGLTFLSKATGINMIIDPKIFDLKSEDELMIQLKVDEISLREILNLITNLKELEWAVIHDVIYCSRGEDLKHFKTRWWIEDAAGGEGATVKPLLQNLRSKRIPLLFNDTPFLDALEFLGELTDVKFLCTQGARATLAGKTLTLRVKKLCAEKALRLMLMSYDLDYWAGRRMVWISLRGERETEAVRKALEKPISPEFRDTPLQAAASVLTLRSGFNVVIDPETAAEALKTGMQVTLSAKAIPVRNALQMFSSFQLLDFIVLHGVAYVAKPEALLRYRSLKWYGDDPKAVLPKADKEVLSRLRQRTITLDTAGMPLQAAVQTVLKEGETDFIFKQGVEKKRPVTLAVKDLSLENALRLILMPQGLKFRIQGTQVLIEPRG